MICEYCGNEHDGTYGSGRFCNITCKNCFNFIKARKQHIINVNVITQRKHEEEQNTEYVCEKCGKHYLLKDGVSKRFCCKSCAASRIHSEETKQKVSETLLKRRETQNFKTDFTIRYCKDCGKQLSFTNKMGYCSMCCAKHIVRSPETIEKLRIAGIHSAQKNAEEKRSKNEKAFCELCEKQFENVTHNENIFNGWDADIIINDYKIAILWNGPWHYRKLTKTHSLKQVQNRDKIKIKEIEKCGYIPYIIKDLGSFNLKKVNEEFKKFLEYINTIMP